MKSSASRGPVPVTYWQHVGAIRAYGYGSSMTKKTYSVPGFFNLTMLMLSQFSGTLSKRYVCSRAVILLSFR